ncbi:putative inorganic polyphosphate/ATP-NAD kinase [Candidatus Sulfotelmatobacter kueseliae]|uniref:NAD kinase n=1 Tax=Candidatus Sulfotelmatobacter kueseliae TaxID=2042962 RepID=A0A2U3K0M0_9BACT|nr:putative inorganic polyphosphate/ATP-NAD kinase [Candidatus Sulfotelmatobacter kueseliae]
MPSPQASPQKTAAIISRPDRSQVAQVIPGLLTWFAEHGYRVVVDEETAKYTTGQEIVPRPEMGARPLDLAVVLGGDGTLLSAARVTAAIDVPLLGVNLGSLGFLTEVPIQSLYSMLDAIAEGRAAVERRSLMQCELLRGDTVRGSYLVFNDAVVNKTALARLNNYDLYVDKTFVSSYRADGMIVATPTGSTAYSLSAGGPVLMPTVNAFVITPVAPHSLTHRPLVVPDSVEIEILLRSQEEVAYLSLDGQPGLDLRDGDRVRCRRSEHQVTLFRTGLDFFHVLRSKLKWGERERQD